jgi:hypothetical protein
MAAIPAHAIIFRELTNSSRSSVFASFASDLTISCRLSRILPNTSLTDRPIMIATPLRLQDFCGAELTLLLCRQSGCRLDAQVDVSIHCRWLNSNTQRKAGALGAGFFSA